MANLRIGLSIGYHEFDIASREVKDIVMQDIISVFVYIYIKKKKKKWAGQKSLNFPIGK